MTIKKVEGHITKTTDKYGGGIQLDGQQWYNFSKELTPVAKARLTKDSDVIVEIAEDDGKWYITAVHKSEINLDAPPRNSSGEKSLLQEIKKKYPDFPDEYVITLRGKSQNQTITAAGLLWIAKEEGLYSTDTELIAHGFCMVKDPSKKTEEQMTGASYAIVKATIHLKDKVRGSVSYSALGDATRENTGDLMRMHLIRMAETRAFSRAYRQALNMDVAAEEMGDDTHGN